MANIITFDDLITPHQPKQTKEPKPRLTTIRTANERVLNGLQLGDPVPLMGDLWYEGNIAILFGDNGAGKSRLAVQVADAIARGEPVFGGLEASAPRKVLYYDFELGDRQFMRRYRAHEFSDNLITPRINYVDGDQFGVQHVIADVEATKARVVVIDNIWAIATTGTQKMDEALVVMQMALKLKHEHRCSVLLITHGNKVRDGRPLDKNDISGSKQLSNLAEHILVIGRGPDRRSIYMRDLKNRDAESGERELDMILSDGENAMLKFERFAVAETLWDDLGDSDRKEMKVDQVLKWHASGLSLRQVADCFKQQFGYGIAPNTVKNWVKRYGTSGAVMAKNTDIEFNEKPF